MVSGTDCAGNTLVIPRGIPFRGRIDSCETLPVEGVLVTELKGFRVLAVVPSGVIRGSADVELADIGGTLEGTLTLGELLTLRASGRVLCKTISYGKLEIACGGIVIGAVEPIAEAAKLPQVPFRRCNRTTGGRNVRQTAYRSRFPANAPAMPSRWNSPPTSS